MCNIKQLMLGCHVITLSVSSYMFFSEATGALESEVDVNLTAVSYPRLAFHTTNPEQK